MDTERIQKIAVEGLWECNADRERFHSVMGVLYQLFPIGPVDFDTTHLDAVNRARIAYVADHLPSEHLRALAEVARLMFLFPDQCAEGIAYLAAENRRFAAAYERAHGVDQARESASQ